MYNKTVLDNSVKVVTERLPSRLISIGIWVDVGSRDEDENNNGSAHFVEHMLFKGTHSRSAQQISRELDMLGGMSNAFTSTEHTCYYITVLDDYLQEAVDLLTDIFLNSVFSPKEIDRERQVILQEIAMVEDTPDDRVHELFSSSFWQGHGLANTVLGRAEVVEKFDAEGLKGYVNANYRPERIVISAAGNVDHHALVKLIGKRFCIVPSSNLQPVSRQRPVQSKVVTTRQIVTRPLEQAHLVMGTVGLPVNSPDRYKLLILNTILGGNMSSRLFQEIREKRGLAYSIYSYLSSNSDCGYAAIYLGIDPKHLSEGIGLIQEQLVRLFRDDISDSELAGAIKYVNTGIHLAAENMEVRMSSLAKNEFSFGRYLALDELTDAIDKVTVKGVHELARQLFNNDTLPLCVIGPVSEI